MSEEMKYNNLGFALAAIETLEYAAFEKKLPKKEHGQVLTDIGFTVDADDATVSCHVINTFMNHKQDAFLKIAIACTFMIDPKGFKELSNQLQTFTIPMKLARHFAVLTVGTVRGVMHSKTENTPFNEFLLPTIDIATIISEDMELK